MPTLETAITTAVSSEVKNYVNEGMLILPPNYSAENALKSAMLALPAVMDKQGVPALQSCTQESIQQALLSMCMQGLNPDKKQCYFIAYGSKLTMSRSYFGDIAVVKQLDPGIEDVTATVVHEGDEFTYEIYHGYYRNIVHKQKLSNKTKPIIAAYATIIYKNGKDVSTVMTYEQIKQSWKQSKSKPILANGNVDPDSTHGKFPEEMAKRTVTRKACKPIIDSSNDSNLMGTFAKRSNDDSDAIEVEADIIQNANYVELDDGIVVDTDTGEVVEEEPFN